MNIKEFEKKIGYAYNNVDLLKLALTHSSYGNGVLRRCSTGADGK